MADEEDQTLAELHERNRPTTTPVAVRLPEPLLAEMDAIWRERDYESRSEFVRTALREVVDNPEVVDGDGRDGPLHD